MFEGFYESWQTMQLFGCFFYRAVQDNGQNLHNLQYQHLIALTKNCIV